MGFHLADENSDFRRQLIELLDVRVTSFRENKQKVAHVICMLGDEIVEIASKVKAEKENNGLRFVLESSRSRRKHVTKRLAVHLPGQPGGHKV